MLNDMQRKYADAPVRFVLVPCNQFASQEPAPDAQVKEFAEKSVSLAGSSNVVMLAKSNLNGVSCPASDQNTCMPSSVGCCPKNDAVYDYLLSATPPGKIKWNFDKVIVGKDGKPFSGEAILHGDALEPALSAVIDRLLAQVEETDAVVSKAMVATAPSSGVLHTRTIVVAATALAIVFVAARSRGSGRARREAEEGETDSAYYLVA